MDAWLTNGDAVRALPFEELLSKFRPLINKFSFSGGKSRWAKAGIPGYDVEDFEQEAALVLWKCQRSYAPERKLGFDGKPSSFINFYIRAVENRFGQLRAGTDKYHRPITELECVACQRRIPVVGRAKCVCSSRRWKAIRGELVTSLDGLLHEPAVEFKNEEVVELLGELPPQLIDTAQRLLSGDPISASEKRSLSEFGDRDDLPPEMAYQKSIRRGVNR